MIKECHEVGNESLSIRWTGDEIAEDILSVYNVSADVHSSTVHERFLPVSLSLKDQPPRDIETMQLGFSCLRFVKSEKVDGSVPGIGPICESQLA